MQSKGPDDTLRMRSPYEQLIAYYWLCYYHNWWKLNYTTEVCLLWLMSKQLEADSKHCNIEKISNISVIISSLQANIDAYANSVDPNDEPSHQDLHCLPFWVLVLETPVLKNGPSKFEDGRNHFRNSGVKELTHLCLASHKREFGKQCRPWSVVS